MLDPNGVELQMLGPEYEVAEWSKEMRYVYALRNSEGKRQLGRIDLSNVQFQPLVELPIDWVPGNRINQMIRLSLSHDGKSLALPVVKPSGDIWLLDGFELPPSLWQRLWR